MITTHVLDVSVGRPAANVGVMLEQLDAYGQSRIVGEARTDVDGRVRHLISDAALEPGRYRLTFEVGAYFTETRRESFYPHVNVTFEIRDVTEQYHVPLLVSPFGYSTYRGS